MPERIDKGEKMIAPQKLQAALRRIHAMDRCQCIHALTHFKDIPLDFDETFLSGMSTPRLQHLLAAAVETAHRRARTGRPGHAPRSACRA